MSAHDQRIKLRATDGANLGTVPAGLGAAGIAYDGANLWVVSSVDPLVTKLRASDGAILGTFPVASGPYGVTFDGANVWVTNDTANTITRY